MAKGVVCSEMHLAGLMQLKEKCKMSERDAEALWGGL